MRALIRLTKLPRVPFQPTEAKSATSMCLKPTRQTSNWSMKNKPTQKHIINTLKTSQDLKSLGVAPRPRSKAIGLGSFRRNEMNEILVGDTFHWMQLECKIDMIRIRRRQLIKFLHDTSEQKNWSRFQSLISHLRTLNWTQHRLGQSRSHLQTLDGSHLLSINNNFCSFSVEFVKKLGKCSSMNWTQSY